VLRPQSALGDGSTDTEAATAVEIAPEVTPKFDVISNLKLLDDVKVAVGIQEGA
jgi:hypothetical protein